MEWEENKRPQTERGPLMEEKADASESDAADPDPSPEPSRAPLDCVRRAGAAPPTRNLHLRSQRISAPASLAVVFLLLGSAFGPMVAVPARADALERVRRTGRLLYGSDMEG